MAPTESTKIPQSGLEARRAAREQIWGSPTSGVAPGYLQANLIVLPHQYAQDFETLCARNPVPCPLLAKSSKPGDFNNFTSCLQSICDSDLAASMDIRTDAPLYNVYENGTMVRTAVPEIVSFWQQDHVAFLIGCSYSFEDALARTGLAPPHMIHKRNVSMYRSNIPLCPAGDFTGSSYVVSMRLYRKSEIEVVRRITRPYTTTHGEPMAWGWDGAESIGVKDVNAVDWGDVPVTREGDVVSRQEEEAMEDGYGVLGLRSNSSGSRYESTDTRSNCRSCPWL